MGTVLKSNIVFWELLRGGLWEEDVNLSQAERIDYERIFLLSQEQSVTGLIAAGLEHTKGVSIPQDVTLMFASVALQLEHRNLAMNHFIEELVGRMREADLFSILVKGQGIAQCYNRPLWRAAGDVDLLCGNDYNKAVAFLAPLATEIKEEGYYKRHYPFIIDSWEVELHGSLRCGLWRRLDNTLDDVQNSVFCDGTVRTWMNGRTQVFIPRADEDVFFVFTHILQHFFKKGIGLRQICDWCRLLWTFRGKINNELLKSRLKSAGILSEWKVFAAFAVNYLGMPKDAIPFYSSKSCWNKKSKRVLNYILETGNFGHNRDLSYYSKNSKIERKAISLWRHTKDSVTYLFIFPIDAIKVWGKMIDVGIKDFLK